MTVAIIDDFQVDRTHISECVRTFFKEQGEPPARLVEFASGESFLDSLGENRYDLVLLDCYMDGMNGLQTAREFRKHDKHALLIFITSCGDYAVDGYLVDAAGYLMKPFTQADFTRTFSAAQHRLPHRREYICLPASQEDTKVPVDEIVYCDVEGHYVQCHLSDRSIVRSRLSFSQLRAKLESYPQFMECYRGCIINLARTTRAEELNFLMDTGERVPFRKKEQGKLFQRYSNFLFDQIEADRA